MSTNTGSNTSNTELTAGETPHPNCTYMCVRTSWKTLRQSEKNICFVLICIVSFALPCSSTVKTTCLFKHSDQENKNQLVLTSMLLPHSNVTQLNTTKSEKRLPNPSNWTIRGDCECRISLIQNVCFLPC